MGVQKSLLSIGPSMDAVAIGADILIAGNQIAKSTREAADDISASNDRQAAATKELKETLEGEFAKQEAKEQDYYKNYISLTDIHLPSKIDNIVSVDIASDFTSSDVLKYDDCEVIEKSSNAGLEGNIVRIMTIHNLYVNSYFDIRVDTDNFFNINVGDIIYLDMYKHIDNVLVDKKYFKEYFDYELLKDQQEYEVNKLRSSIESSGIRILSTTKRLNSTIEDRDNLRLGNIILPILMTALMTIFLFLSIFGKGYSLKVTSSIFTIIFGIASAVAFIDYGWGLKRRLEYNSLDNIVLKQREELDALEKEKRQLQDVLRDKEGTLTLMNRYLKELKAEGIKAFVKELKNENEY